MNATEITKALIACHSTTPHVGAAFDVLEGYLKPLGFEVWREVFNDDNHPTENLYARWGTAAPNLCFAGHLDVVPAGDWSRWTYPPFEPTEAGGYLYGRGAEDMKGAIGAFVAAASGYIAGMGPHPNPLTREKDMGVSFSRAQSPMGEGTRITSPNGRGQNGEAILGEGSISFLITGDEEGSAINGTQKMLDWLSAKGERIDACLVGEPTNPSELGEMLKVGRRGSFNVRLTAHGTQGHVAYPHLADNPNRKLIACLNALQQHALDAGTEFFPPSNLEVTSIDVGNETGNLIPAQAVARLNIRFNNLHSAASLEGWVRTICDEHLGEGSYALECSCSGEAFLTRDDTLTNALVAAIEKVLGRTPEISTTGGTSDARFIKNICPVIEFGTTGSTAHHIDERVRAMVLEQLSAVYLEFIKGYLLA